MEQHQSGWCYYKDRKFMWSGVKCAKRNMNSSTECPICLEKDVHPQDQAIIPECGHLFCMLCIKRWAERHPGLTLGCPLCRQIFRKVIYFEEARDECGSVWWTHIKCIYCIIDGNWLQELKIQLTNSFECLLNLNLYYCVFISVGRTDVYWSLSILFIFCVLCSGLGLSTV